MGCDTRASGAQLMAWLLAGLQAGQVEDLGVVTTPVVAYETARRGASLGIVLTASHNPPEYNGLKFFERSGLKLTESRARSWSERVESGTISAKGNASAELARTPVLPDHYAGLLHHHFRKPDFHGVTLAWDLANGAASARVPQWLRELTDNPVIMGVSPDGNNINQGCGAMAVEALGELVCDQGLNAGFALDGDGDRLVVVGPDGQPIHGDLVLYGLVQAMAREGQNITTVVGTILTGLGLETRLAQDGIRLLRTPVGDQHVLAAMVEQGWLVGGEPSGHLIQADLFPAGDGLLAALRLARAMAADPHFWKEIAASVALLPTLECNISVRHKPPLASLPTLSEAARELEHHMGSRGRLILRYSGTEPKIRLVVESGELAQFEQPIQALKTTIERELGHA
jgi:phosphoglucosamine mutase